MIVYAIKHIPTSNLMPARMFRTQGIGWSWWEPTETRPGYLPHDANPRLFFTRASAANSLGQWLRGPLNKIEVGKGYSSFGNEAYRTEVGSVDPTLSPPGPDRRREDMAIMEFILLMGD
jgi:hypothetical protein